MTKPARKHVRPRFAAAAAWLESALGACLLLASLGWVAGCGGPAEKTPAYSPMPPDPPGLRKDDDAAVFQQGPAKPEGTDTPSRK